ncbi:arginyl-tRNA synthetase [Metschnikowia bicuspidata]|uniref:arginine--tRNA ligase n=1 Tax=Metschnikowia bicuspidata TaxID=27322 RepID=A0A4P9Z9E1_9ASCO|nr:arginyl-tRNA synthetase [Metschnikowia bicuspidata]
MATVDTISGTLVQLGLNESTPVAGAYPRSNVMDVMRCYITSELHKLSGTAPDVIFFALDSPITMDKGDLLVPLPRLRLPKGTDFKAKAGELAEAFPKGGYLRDVRAEGQFLQFFFAPSALFNLVIKDVLTRRENYGYLPVGEGKLMIVEFSSPNIAKPFHAGHLRSTIIGGFLANLYEKAGWKVTRFNYLGDWGKQFGLLAVGFEKYGDEAKLASDPINHLFDVYVRVNKDITDEGEVADGTNDKVRKYFKRMEDGDAAALDIWKRFRSLSIDKYIDTYARLNITYDVYSGESQVSQERIKNVMDMFALKGLLHEDRGAKLIDLTKFNKKLGSCVVQKSDGTSLYLTRDVGEAIKRYELFQFDKMIYVIASQQDLHTAQFFEILKQLGYEWANKLEHVNFGMVQGMSTRKGTVVFLDNILEETKQQMHEVMKRNQTKYVQIEDPDRVADLVGISAVMIQDMQSKRINNYEFKWDRMLSFEGDTGPYLQYAHSRLSSVQRKAAISEEKLLSANFDLLTEPEALTLVRCLSQYPDTIKKALKTHEPSTIVTYLFNLTHIVSSCYDTLWVAGQEEELATARLALYVAAKQVLNNGMKLLGLTPVDRM